MTDYKALPTAALHALARERIKGHRPTWVEVNLGCLVHNLEVVRRCVGAGVRILAVVKADAYGHGTVPVARTLEKSGIEWLGVALPEEGVALREAGITCPILCLGGFWRDQEEAILDYNLTPVIYRLDMLETLDRAAGERNLVVDYHLKVDTGMGRLGVPYDEFPAFVSQLKKFSHLFLDGLLTHIAAADDPEFAAFSREQTARYRVALALIDAAGFRPTYRHIANSAAAAGFPEARENLVRVGALLYGLARGIVANPSALADLLPVMSLHSRITQLKTVHAGSYLGYGCTFKAMRETRVATLPVGYDDGYHRAHSNRAQVIVRSRLAPVVGRVSMDITLADVTDVPEVELGDEVLLMGQRDGLSIRAEDLAAEIDTVPYEVVCSISGRVPRIYRNEPESHS